MKLPSRVRLSNHASDRLKLIKGWTGLTPNIVARIAIMLVIRDNTSLDNAGLQDTDGQELHKGVLFGDQADTFEVLLRQYFHDNVSAEESVQKTIASMVEIGVHKIGHVRSLADLAAHVAVDSGT